MLLTTHRIFQLNGKLCKVYPTLLLLEGKLNLYNFTTRRLINYQAGLIEGDAPFPRYGPRRPNVEYERQVVKHIPQKPYDPLNSKRTGVIAKKKGMTCLWDNLGNQVPCTVLQIQDCQVTYVKTLEKEGYLALQVGAVDVAQHKLTRSVLGHFVANGVTPKRHLVEFRVSEDAVLPIGTKLSAAHFVPGQYVDARAPSKGKGFQGGMKRHGFAGLPASHGVSVSHRSIGSTGQRARPGRVFKGKKMPGRMGGQMVTVMNAQVIKIDVGLNLVYLKGCVPGCKEQYVTLVDAVRKPGWTKFGAAWTEAYQPASDLYKPPFPTFDPAELPNFPREVMARLSQPSVPRTETKDK